jgi:hypothetical protein
MTVPQNGMRQLRRESDPDPVDAQRQLNIFNSEEPGRLSCAPYSSVLAIVHNDCKGPIFQILAPLSVAVFRYSHAPSRDA